MKNNMGWKMIPPLVLRLPHILMIIEKTKREKLLVIYRD